MTCRSAAARRRALSYPAAGSRRWLPVGPMDVHPRCDERALGCSAVGLKEWLCLGRENMLRSGERRAPVCSSVGSPNTTGMMGGCVKVQHGRVTCTLLSGVEKAAIPGTRGRVQGPPQEATWQSSCGPARPGVRGMSARVLLRSTGAGWTSSCGRQKMIVR